MAELPLHPSEKSPSTPAQIEQLSRGDQTQTIGQVQGGIVLYVSGGKTIINSGPGESGAGQGDDSEASTVSTDIGPNPYKGLLAFHEEDCDRYFGRSVEIQRLWDDLRTLHERQGAIRLLPIYGPSGSGKSSLARAGLIPELGRLPLPGRNRARVAVLVPGTDPVQALANILARIDPQEMTFAKKSREFAEELMLANKVGQQDGLYS